MRLKDTTPDSLARPGRSTLSAPIFANLLAIQCLPARQPTRRPEEHYTSGWRYLSALRKFSITQISVVLGPVVPVVKAILRPEG